MPSANYYWSATARNDTSGRYSNVSNVFPWGGANIQPYNSNTGNGGMNGNQYRPNSVGFTTIGNSVAALGLIGTSSFQVASTPDPNVATILPIDITTANGIVPVYITGANTDPNYYYPFYQNTSTTANGYYANSAGEFTPGGATFLTLFNGDDDWYIFFATPFTEPVQDSIQYARTEYDVQIVTTEPTTIQILPATSANFANGYLTDSQSIRSYDLLTANIPYSLNGFFEQIPVGYDPEYGAVFIKNLGNTTANVILVSGDASWYRGKL